MREVCVGGVDGTGEDARAKKGRGPIFDRCADYLDGHIWLSGQMSGFRS